MLAVSVDVLLPLALAALVVPPVLANVHLRAWVALLVGWFYGAVGSFLTYGVLPSMIDRDASTDPEAALAGFVASVVLSFVASVAVTICFALTRFVRRRTRRKA
jgi:membrane associated rhomboid family serine protease